MVIRDTKSFVLQVLTVELAVKMTAIASLAAFADLTSLDRESGVTADQNTQYIVLDHLKGSLLLV